VESESTEQKVIVVENLFSVMEKEEGAENIFNGLILLVQKFLQKLEK
jgi:hypothetical protein